MSDGLDHAIEQSRSALREIINGSSAVYEDLFSPEDDATLGNPYGPFARGRTEIVVTLAGAAARYQEGEILEIDRLATHVGDQFACIVEVERFRTKFVGRDDFAEVGLRVTSLFRPEDGTWRLVHRHADPITAPRPTESVLPG